MSYGLIGIILFNSIIKIYNLDYLAFFGFYFSYYILNLEKNNFFYHLLIYTATII